MNAPIGHENGRYDFVLPAYGASIEPHQTPPLTGWHIVEKEPVQDGIDLLLGHETMDPSDPISFLRVRDASEHGLELNTMVEVGFKIEDGLLFPCDP